MKKRKKGENRQYNNRRKAVLKMLLVNFRLRKKIAKSIKNIINFHLNKKWKVKNVTFRIVKKM